MPKGTITITDRGRRTKPGNRLNPAATINCVVGLRQVSGKRTSGSAEPAILNMLSDARSTFRAADEAPLPFETHASEDVLQELLAQADQEFADLLEDVQAASLNTCVEEASGPPTKELLMRAVRCAAKQYMLQAQLGSLALKDELTGLYNRRGFTAIAERQLKLARRCGKGMLLFFLDVDGLKEINDLFGHSEGDRALKRVSAALLKTFRDSDVVGRLGGDEFAVIAIEASGQGEARIRERLWGYLKSKSNEDTVYTISVSLGTARYDPRRSVSLDELIVRADAGMYDEKKTKCSRR